MSGMRSSCASVRRRAAAAAAAGPRGWAAAGPGRRRAARAAAGGNGTSEEYTGQAFTIKTFNAISEVGLERFPGGRYEVSGDDAALSSEAMAIMLRSHKLSAAEVPKTCRCIARCGAGTNNIPVKEMTALGVPVFNTPGANADAVKELVVCALLLASRGIVEGIAHVREVINVEEDLDNERIAKRIEKDKKMFKGVELAGKTLGVIGLGQIGGRVVEAALGLNMAVVGYDPQLSLEAALKLPGDRMERCETLEELMRAADYVSIHVPYIPGVTHHLIDAAMMRAAKPGLNILNFARGEIVDGEALKAMYDSGAMTGKYVSDFADEHLNGHPKHIVMPHLGASTEEAEENSAMMAAETIMLFLQTGSIRHSVNFPTTMVGPNNGYRLCLVHRNEPGALGSITTYLGEKNINITRQVNNSRGDIAYTVVDMDEAPADADALQDELVGCFDGLLSSRFIGQVFKDEMGSPGTYFRVYGDSLIPESG